jgi:hypothetical protein
MTDHRAFDLFGQPPSLNVHKYYFPIPEIFSPQGSEENTQIYISS